MWEKKTEKYLMMKLLKHDIQIYWQEAVLISFLPVFYMPPLASSLLVYLIQYFHPFTQPCLIFFLTQFLHSFFSLNHVFPCLSSLVCIQYFFSCFSYSCATGFYTVCFPYSNFIIYYCSLNLIPKVLFQLLEIQMKVQGYWLFKQPLS